MSEIEELPEDVAIGAAIGAEHATSEKILAIPEPDAPVTDAEYAAAHYENEIYDLKEAVNLQITRVAAAVEAHAGALAKIEELRAIIAGPGTQFEKITGVVAALRK